MAEIALRTTERKLQKAKYLAWQPVGAVVCTCSDSCIRRKWLEICCDLVAPYKRKDYTALPGYDELIAAWTPELREAWLEADRPTEKYTLGRLLMDRTYPQKLWNSLVVPVGVVSNLPLAPESNIKVSDTWLWSKTERKHFFMVVNIDAGDEEVQDWQGVEERMDRDKLVMVSRKQIKYETNIGLSAGTLANISDPDVVVNPKFDSPVVKAKVIQPDLADSVIAMRL